MKTIDLTQPSAGRRSNFTMSSIASGLAAGEQIAGAVVDAGLYLHQSQDRRE
jgi:ribosomal protein S12 methylthiotransferase accessory factor YcaO